MKKQAIKKSMTLDKLALMVGEGFNETHKELNSIKTDTQIMKDDIVELKEGQEHIKLRLDSVAYRFELVEVQKRLERLEHKAGIKYR